MTPFARDIDTGIDAATNRPKMQSFATLTEATSNERMTADNDDNHDSRSGILVRRRRRWSRLNGRA